MIHKSKSGITTFYTKTLELDMMRDLIDIFKKYNKEVRIYDIKSDEGQFNLALTYSGITDNVDNLDGEYLEQIEFDMFKLYHDMNIQGLNGTYIWGHFPDSMSTYDDNKLKIQITLKRTNYDRLTYLDLLPVDLLIKIGSVILEHNHKETTTPHLYMPHEIPSLEDYFKGINGLDKGICINLEAGELLRS